MVYEEPQNRIGKLIGLRRILKKWKSGTSMEN